VLPAPLDEADERLRALLPAGWTMRPLAGADGTVPDDVVDAAFDVALRCEAACGIDSETTREEIAMFADGPESDPAGARLVSDASGRAAAVSLLEVDVEARRVVCDVYADPDHEGMPEGLWAAVMRAGVARGEQVAAALGGPWRAESGAYEQDERYRAVLAAAGLTPRRRFHRMRVDLAGTTVAGPVPPAGLSVVVPETDEQLRATWAVLQESFRDHWGATAQSYDGWLSYLRAMPGYDPTQWALALADGEPAGACLGDDSRDGVNDGYVRLLGVLEPYRGRGLARYLLLRAFEQARAKGRAGVQLGVDAANETGATALYESVGMRPVRVIEAWWAELPLA
jgi:ribosomal protein S18 acetylase RimI-like enzyme